MFLILPMSAVTVGWIILKGASDNGKNKEKMQVLNDGADEEDFK